MKTISKFIATLSDETIEAANQIHRFYIDNEDIGESFDAHMELHELLIKHIEDFVLNEGITQVRETYNGDQVEVFLCQHDDGTFFPSVRTNHIDAPASTIDPTLGVSFEQAMAWGFGDAIIAHILEQGII
jgi:hypothetical protein